jgi:FAD-dependent urate hydroxylase
VVDVLVIGAGPYGLASARAATQLGLTTRVLGRPMSFWRDHMPTGMFLRSGPDWHMDPANELTFEAFTSKPPDPIPLGLFLDYADWFRTQANIQVEDRRVTSLTEDLKATLDDGTTIEARAVVAAPGVAHFTHRPEWATQIPGEHTCDLTHFKDVSGARVLIIGGRQSAYEWAALIQEAGAESVDLVHRHDPPRFEKVSWRFVDPHVESTLAHAGWWRSLVPAERAAIARRFWEVGRLTLEPWLTPRLTKARVHANAEVIKANPGAVTLDNGTTIAFDRIVYATGYKADAAKVPYLPQLETSDGFPALDEHMQASVPGLYLPGFTATNDFGPFFGFVKGAPAAATLVARGLDRASTKG